MKDFACAYRRDGVTGTVKARLDGGSLHLSGAVVGVTPFAAFTRVEVAGTWLHLEGPDGAFALGLGDRAASWAARITGPLGRMKRLGIAPGTTVRWMGVPTPEERAELLAAGAVLDGFQYADVVVMGVSRGPIALGPALEVLVLLKAPEGAIWLPRPKDFPLPELRAIANAIGLVDVAAMKWDDTRLAEKWVYERQVPPGG